MTLFDIQGSSGSRYRNFGVKQFVGNHRCQDSSPVAEFERLQNSTPKTAIAFHGHFLDRFARFYLAKCVRCIRGQSISECFGSIWKRRHAKWHKVVTPWWTSIVIFVASHLFTLAGWLEADASDQGLGRRRIRHTEKYTKKRQEKQWNTME